MKRILIVKLTSLGDMVFTQPLVADLRRAFPGVRIDWIADSYCADVPSWNPDIDRVISAPLRAFKKQRSWANLRGIFKALWDLRRERYDAVLDVHGVYKSAIVSFLARTRRRYGHPVSELGESGARFAYSDIFIPARHADCARTRMRRAVSSALGYPLTPSYEYGLRLPPSTEVGSAPYAMLFHATSSEEKKWPRADWIAVGQSLAARGLQVLVPWGSAQERAEAEGIVAGVPGAQLAPRLDITGCARIVAGAALVVGMDTGFVHIAEALGRPTVMLFTQTSRVLFGVDVPGRVVSLGGDGVVPSRDEALTAIDAVLRGTPDAAAPAVREAVRPASEAAGAHPGSAPVPLHAAPL